jgi:ABC-2 type transport system ATP-binding protein
MAITLDNLGKRFNREWIFRGVNLQLLSGQSYTFVGPNGSGKSTLLQVIAGAMPGTEGTISYQFNNQAIEIDSWYQQITLAAPYLELIEEFTPSELLRFHQQFKPFKPSVTIESLLDALEMTKDRHKSIKYFSSGMKQRLKLALAFESDVPVVMLDEPTSNLDARWTNWYQEQVSQLDARQILLICSNLPHEYDFCQNIVNLGSYKP